MRSSKVQAAAHPAIREPKSRPIAFDHPENIRGILAGTKTQTRRVLGNQGKLIEICASVPNCLDSMIDRCKYGRAGDRLWVREGLRRGPFKNLLGTEQPEYPTAYYSVDGESVLWQPGDFDVAWPWKPRALSARYCPRWASRIDLEVTEIRVQRIQEITQSDARAEGVVDTTGAWEVDAPLKDTDRAGPRGAFEALWNTINEPRGFGWAANPWVFAISFRRVRP